VTLSRLTDLRLLGRTAFLVTAAAVVAMFLWVSDSLVRDLARQERERMQLWADATREMVRVLSADDGAPRVDVDFLLGIIEANTTIPVLLTDGPLRCFSPTEAATSSSTATSHSPNLSTPWRP